MGWNSPNVPWSDIERTLSDLLPLRSTRNLWAGEDVDGATRSQKRRTCDSSTKMAERHNTTPYAELHCHSNFSFLDGASHPEELVEEAARLDLQALALTDHNGFYGVVLRPLDLLACRLCLVPS